MKVAAILALIVAVVLGAWTINDYLNQEAVKRDTQRNGFVYFTMRTDSGDTVRLDLREVTAYYERRDAKVGALSAAFLIGSIGLFWRRSKVAIAVDRK